MWVIWCLPKSRDTRLGQLRYIFACFFSSHCISYILCISYWLLLLLLLYLVVLMFLNICYYCCWFCDCGRGVHLNRFFFSLIEITTVVLFCLEYFINVWKIVGILLIQMRGHIVLNKSDRRDIKLKHEISISEKNEKKTTIRK